MKRIDLANSRLLLGVLIPLCPFIIGTACGAEDFATTSTSTTTTTQPATKSPELESADQRCEAAKSKLDNARKVLSAAKASLRAAEAEFKASKADRDALALRQTAQQLADASGFGVTTPVEPVRQIIVPPSGNRLTPVAVPVGANQFGAAPGAAATPGRPLTDFNGAPSPNGDLQPNNTVEPSPVP